MSAAPKYTEREMVLAKREAFRDGSRWLSCWCSCNGAYDDYRWIAGDSRGRPEEAAAERYPLPKVTRPRVVKNVPMWMNYEFRVVDRVFQSRTLTSGLDDWSVQTISTRRTFEQLGPVYADLLANPTEEVDADA